MRRIDEQEAFGMDMYRSEEVRKAVEALVCTQLVNFMLDLTDELDAAELAGALRKEVRKRVTKIARSAINSQPSVRPHAKNLVALVAGQIRQEQADEVDRHRNLLRHTAPIATVSA